MSEEGVTSTPATFPDEEDDGLLTRCLQKHKILTALGFWCFFVLCSLQVNFSLGLVGMVNGTKVWSSMTDNADLNICLLYDKFHREIDEDGPMTWSPVLQGHLLASNYYGLAITQLVGEPLSDVLSPKWVLLLGTLLAVLCNSLVPIASTNSVYAVIVLQICKGLGQGVIVPAFGVMMQNWVPRADRYRLMPYITSGLPLGGFFGFLASGYISHRGFMRWPYVFYSFGLLGLIWCVFWAMVVQESGLPRTHRRTTRNELHRLSVIEAHQQTLKDRPVPLKSILTSKAMWAYVAAGFASCWCLNLYTTVMPFYMVTVLKYGFVNNGVMSGLPFLAETFTLMGTTLFSDRVLKKKTLRPTALRKITVCTGLSGCAVCLAFVPYTGCTRLSSGILLVAALGIVGISLSAITAIPIDMAPSFSGTVYGIMHTIGCLSGVIIPTRMGYLTQNKQTVNEWSALFHATAAICAFGALIFLLLGSSELQPWSPVLDSQISELEAALSRSFSQEERKSDPPSQKVLVPRKPPRKGQSRKSTDEEKRPWRTDSYPDLTSPHEPDVVVPYRPSISVTTEEN